MSFYDDELVETFTVKTLDFTQISSEGEKEYIALMHASFPFIFGRIDWSSMQNTFLYQGESISKGIEEIAEEIQRIEGGHFITIGDALTESAYRFNTADFKLVASTFLEIPQHTYFLIPEIKWVSCISFEGDFDGIELSACQ